MFGVVVLLGSGYWPRSRLVEVSAILSLSEPGKYKAKESIKEITMWVILRWDLVLGYGRLFEERVAIVLIAAKRSRPEVVIVIRTAVHGVVRCTVVGTRYAKKCLYRDALPDVALVEKTLWYDEGGCDVVS